MEQVPSAKARGWEEAWAEAAEIGQEPGPAEIVFVRIAAKERRINRECHVMK
jgi:hypothetical protein